jgi:hypothetical protein
MVCQQQATSIGHEQGQDPQRENESENTGNHIQVDVTEPTHCASWLVAFFLALRLLPPLRFGIEIILNL